ncbi:MAG TPA: amidohydrolase family protein [Burkholderiales bacterium]|nr:amidohydrolase family protein [Burkholderiales bacterium]
MKIDIHAHWYPKEWVELLEKEGGSIGAQIGRNARGQVTFAVPGYKQNFQEQYIDLPVRLKMMDDARVDVHALSLTSPMIYWAPPEFGLKLAQVYNDGLARAHTQYPDRFLGLATVPMQAPELAVKEVERAFKLPGIRGIYMGTHVMGRNLDDEAFRPVYAKCEELGLAIFLHPLNPVGADRMAKYHLRNLIGNPTDNAIAAASLIFGGVMDAFPKLDVVLPHAGGTMPSLIGRWDHGTTVRSELTHMKKPPSSYIRRFHYDTITHHDWILTNLIEQVGADRVVMGSDCPADMSYTRPVDVVERLKDVSANDRGAILGANAARLLRLQG